MTFYARNEYEATAGQTDFVFSFPYISSAHIHAYVNGIEETDWTLASATTLRFDSGLSEGDVVVIKRETSYNNRLVDWVGGTVITEQDLDEDSLQGFYMAQEAVDNAAISGLPIGDDAQYTAGNKNIRDVATPTEGSDAVTKDYVDSLVIASGNVPPPDNPGENNYALLASGGSWDWGLITTNNIDLSDGILDFLDSEDVSDARANLSLGTAALYDTGTSEGNIPLLTSGGAMPAVTFGAMTGGQFWVPIDDDDVSGLSTFDIEPAGLDGCEFLKLTLMNFTTTDTANNFINMQWKINGAYRSGTHDYEWLFYAVIPGVGAWENFDMASTEIRLGHYFSDGDYLSFEILITNHPAVAPGFPFGSYNWFHQYNHSNTRVVVFKYGAFRYANSAYYPIEGIRISKSAGTFATGHYYLSKLNSLT